VAKRYTILVCRGPECSEKRHSADLRTELNAELERCQLTSGNTLDTFSCFGKCQKGPNVLVREMTATDNPLMVRLMPTAGRLAVLYHGVRPADARRIVEEHIGRGERVAELLERGLKAEPTTDPIIDPAVAVVTQK
jgi:(2Fe-2S) ferredoxin